VKRCAAAAICTITLLGCGIAQHHTRGEKAREGAIQLCLNHGGLKEFFYNERDERDFSALCRDGRLRRGGGGR